MDELEKWARKLAPDFDSWYLLEAWDQAGQPGGIEDVLGISPDQGDALLARLVKVIELVPKQRSIPTADWFSWLAAQGLISDPVGMELTSFGQEIVRKMVPGKESS